MQVVGPSGGVVGMVISVKGTNLTVKTNKHEVLLPMSSFTANKGKLMFGMSAAQLNAATEQAMAAAKAAVAPGAAVYGSDGSLAGKIESIDEKLVKIKLASGQSVRIPRNGVSGSANGAVLGITTAKLNELASQAGGADSATPAPTPAAAETSGS
jgi:preprotein translocase subunit YajC